MKRRFTIDEADWKHLIELCVTARNTPVIALSVGDGLSGRDFATLARKRIFDFWIELGGKYGFDGNDVTPVDEANRVVEANCVNRK